MGLIGGLANRITAITGRTNWRADPAATLADAKAHHDRTDNPHSVTAAQAGAIPLEQKAAASGVAPLDAASRIPSAHIPPVALSETFVVNSESAQLALTAQEGDVAVRTDLSRTYIHNGGTAGTMADWTELATPPDAVQSVNSKTGTVSLTSADTGSVPTARTVSTTAPLTGGGALSANRTLGITDASASARGAMPAADKSKLDGVRPNDAYADLTISAHQTGIASATWTPVYWNSEISDSRNWHSNTANPERITFGEAGFYCVTFYQRWATPNTNGVRYLRGQLNGSNLFEDSVSAAVDNIGRVTAVRMFAVSAGDYFVLEVNQTSGSSLDLHSVSGIGVARLM